MTKNRWRYFKWTPRSAFITFMYVGFVPGVLLYAFGKTDVSEKTNVPLKMLVRVLNIC